MRNIYLLLACLVEITLVFGSNFSGLGVGLADGTSFSDELDSVFETSGISVKSVSTPASEERLEKIKKRGSKKLTKKSEKKIKKSAKRKAKKKVKKSSKKVVKKKSKKGKKSTKKIDRKRSSRKSSKKSSKSSERKALRKKTRKKSAKSIASGSKKNDKLEDDGVRLGREGALAESGKKDKKSGSNSNSYKKSIIRVTGSSTVFPFTSLVSRYFARKNPNLDPPVVESVGTGGGFKIFCTSGDRIDAPDLVNASRKITSKEMFLCRENGIKNVGMINVGLDAIVLVRAIDKYTKDNPVDDKSAGRDGGKDKNGDKSGKRGASGSTSSLKVVDVSKFNNVILSPRDMFLATSKFVTAAGEVVHNPYKRWNEIRADLPDLPIAVYGPSSNSGTYDTFISLVVQEECMKNDDMLKAVKDYKTLKKKCSYLRSDGVYVGVHQNSAVVKKLLTNKYAVGVLSFNYYYANVNELKAFAVNGFEPSLLNIQRGLYPIARSLYVYFNQDNLDTTRGLREFVFDLFRFAYKRIDPRCFGDDESRGGDGVRLGRGGASAKDDEKSGGVSDDRDKVRDSFGLILVPLLTAADDYEGNLSSLCD